MDEFEKIEEAIMGRFREKLGGYSDIIRDRIDIHIRLYNDGKMEVSELFAKVLKECRSISGISTRYIISRTISYVLESLKEDKVLLFLKEIIDRQVTYISYLANTEDVFNRYIDKYGFRDKLDTMTLTGMVYVNPKIINDLTNEEILECLGDSFGKSGYFKIAMNRYLDKERRVEILLYK